LLLHGDRLDGWYTFVHEPGRNNDPQHIFTINDGQLPVYQYAEDGAELANGVRRDGEVLRKLKSAPPIQLGDQAIQAAGKMNRAASKKQFPATSWAREPCDEVDSMPDYENVLTE
jgi:hypothetical protein